MKIRPIEVLLLEVVFYLVLWIWNDYLATLVSVMFGAIFLMGLLVSLVVELVERSKVPRTYYYLMAVSALAPFLAAGIFILFNGGVIPWMVEGG